MPDYRQPITDAMVDILNQAFEADPGAMHALLCNCVPANQGLIEMPHILVDAYNDQFKTLSMMGVINGMLSAAGLPKVAIKWSEERDEKGRCKLLGFCVYEEPRKEEEASDGNKAE
ncbi:MAG: hypothetical protein WC455_09895 [Dehalococcoidia bacterium]|jgi:hypothetical protein